MSIFKCAVCVLLAIATVAGCAATSTGPAAPDPMKFEEIDVRNYWQFRSNLNGKAISEEKTRDGAWLYGKNLLRRGKVDRSELSLEQWREIEAEAMTDYRVDYVKLAKAGAFIKPFTASLGDVNPITMTVAIDKGMADGVLGGYIAFARKAPAEGAQKNWADMVARYMNEDIGDVIALFEVLSAEEHTARLKILDFRPGYNATDLTPGFCIQFGFPRKSKFDILDKVSLAVEELVATNRFTAESARERLGEALVAFFDGDKETVSEMIWHLTTENADTRKVVNAALRGITKQDFGYDADAPADKRAQAVESWKKWWAENRATFSLTRPQDEKKKENKDKYYYGEWPLE